MLLLVVSGSAIGSGFLLGMVFGGFGYVMPSIWLSRMAKNRKAEITKSLPDAIDLLTISVESGLGFDPALMRVAEKWDNALTREFGQALNELRLGKTEREALREMSDRVYVDDLRIFVSSIIQADQLEVSMSQVLTIQSEAMRVRRRQRAEELAHKAPIKVLFPMVFLIFRPST
ncbi:MAG: type II secretion system F family protein [Chloroflexota bacterium]|nr:type II secretion system F family protein [Chloroflexota bacterium]